MATSGPRIPPGTRASNGLFNFGFALLAGRIMRTTEPPHIFTTLGRHRGLFRRWLFFAGGLMPGGKLPRRDTELVILRVSARTGAEYEADHHRPLARRAEVSPDVIEAAAREGVDEGVFDARQAAIVRAVDELHDDRRISDATWAALRSAGLSDRDLIELCLLAGHYEMLAGTINSLGIERDARRS
jgi:AhpD family alkylhydroperoxidase